MNKQTILVVCAIGLGLAAGYGLGARERSPAAECSDDSELRDTIETLEQDRAALSSRVEVLSASNVSPVSALPQPGPSQPPSAASMRGVFDSRPKPEYRRTMALQQFGALFAELGLSGPQIEAILDVLAAQSARSDQPGKRAGGWFRDDKNVDPAVRSQDEKEIAAAIGAEKAAEFAALRKSLPGRMEVTLARDQLERVGLPLSEDQRRALLANTRNVESPPAPTPVAGESPQSRVERMQNYMSERSQQFRAESASILTPVQRARLEEVDAMQQDMQSRFTSRAGSQLATAGAGAAR